ncbi:MsnO8 family LLM class oxidoreductase [Enterovirga rhinocerotis]|uniref:Luciferase family oxidoreductase group 1 n=1 Tax=Enterovirga rhinocerotis TaxID=1339210 RepID=A0A4R7BMU9_9HYPH|nr:MsnO8 family LLM class oxidoreductase [Enterovirga rhinocerotis]TDR85247.1 luciferase family oxidoreductase group 1 [Enterovirga rhinocerotis]
MTFALSFLDKSPLDGAEIAEAALRRTLDLARKAEELGFVRFWVAEHHNAARLAGSSPEVLIAFLLARTRRIRIGSGGVMLQHYSAYKVAENFNLLASLAPGRVDLGVGKAPGGLPFSTRALQSFHDPDRKPSFEAQLAELDGYLQPHGDDGAPERELAAFPSPPEPADRFLLGASVESARLAARLGWYYVHAAHINGDETAIAQALSTYRAYGGVRPLLAVNVVVAETDQLAEDLAADPRRFRVELENGEGVNVTTRQQALEYVRQIGTDRYRIEERGALFVRGSPARVHAELSRLHRIFGVDEFVVECPVTEAAPRLDTIELLAAAAGLRLAA